MTAIDQPARVASRRPGVRLLIGVQLLVLALYGVAVAALMFLAIKAPGGWAETTPDRLLRYGYPGYVLYAPLWFLSSIGFALAVALVVAGIWSLSRIWRSGGPKWTLAGCTAATALTGLFHVTPVAELVRVWLLR
ncbi:hypothetical protein Rhe02_53110 [Rhizocola hellebori]|uniref:Uncharacterized protein n=1 Tax=Rhizocola hellebori TaxID=1392758 RepID=A0A8J3QAM1_9ACTN|nr:hypothetical protein [Rhizocola hellebori]GIH07244.1 hypothetical protein Rhe02_53110 [Rhizocola hellebori]